MHCKLKICGIDRKFESKTVNINDYEDLIKSYQSSFLQSTILWKEMKKNYPTKYIISNTWNWINSLASSNAIVSCRFGFLTPFQSNLLSGGLSHYCGLSSWHLCSNGISHHIAPFWPIIVVPV